MTLRYDSTAEFDKDLKRLSKRYRTLSQDLETLKRNAIELLHLQHIDNHACLAIPGCVIEGVSAYKVKKFACRSLKGKGAQSGIRITYIYFSTENRILFVEMYYKGDQENENRQRIIDYLKL